MTMEAALAFAARNWSVHPLDHPSLVRCAGIGRNHNPDEPDHERGKHPTTPWMKWATTDVATITAEWSGASRNIGIACGASGLLVIDEDVLDALAKFAASLGDTIPPTYIVRTGRLGGGRHYYFRAPAGLMLGNTEGALKGLGINVRGAGGYVVAAGSLHESGAPYEVEADLPVAACPAWLIRAIQAKSVPVVTLSESGIPVLPSMLGTGLAGVPQVIRGPRQDRPGERHEVLMRYAASLLARDCPMDEARNLMWAVLPRCEQPPQCTSPMTWADAEGILIDVYDRYPAGRSADFAKSVVVNTPGGNRRMTAAELEHWTPPVRIVYVGGLIEAGTTLLGGMPKWGKSYLALDLACGVARAGAKVLAKSMAVDRHAPVVYADFEAGPSLWKQRLAEITDDGWPLDLHMVDMRGLGGDAAIAQMIADVDEVGAGLLIIDTFGRWRLSDSGGKNNYQADTEAMAALAKITYSRPGLALLILHHTNQAPVSDDNWITSLAGTNGIIGVPDTLILGTQANLREGDGALRMLGRYSANTDWALERRGPIWARKDGPLVPGNLGDRSAEVVMAVYHAGKDGTDSATVAQALGLDKPMVNTYLARLADSRTLNKIGRGKYRHPFYGTEEAPSSPVISVGSVISPEDDLDPNNTPNGNNGEPGDDEAEAVRPRPVIDYEQIGREMRERAFRPNEPTL